MGWNQILEKFSGSSQFDLTVYDSRSLALGLGTYSATANWPCNFVNQMIMVGLRGSPSLVQKAANVAATGAFTTWTIAFPANNTGGNTLILDIAFASLIYVAGPVAVTDSQGNQWTLVEAGNPTFQSFFQQCWVASGVASGANTVTITMGGGFHFTEITAAVLEYRGVTGTVDGITYQCGPIFGTGAPISGSITTAGGALLHLATSTVGHCASSTVEGGGYSDCFAAWLVVLEPGSPATWTDQSSRLHMADSIKFSSIARQRGTASVPLYIPAGDSYEPTTGSQVCIWDLTESADYEVFSGTIDDWETKWFGVDGDRVITLTCVSLESMFDTIRVPSNLWEGQTAGFIFKAVFQYAVGSPVALGTIDAGATLADFDTPDWPTIAEVFDKLATESEYVWGVDPGTGEVYFNTPNTTPSPFSLDSEAVLWEQLTKKEERHDYRNQQIMKVPSDVAVLSSELFAGAGQKSFTLLRPVQQVTNGWTTKNVQNHATLTLSGQPSPGDTISFQFPGSSSSFNWAAATVYASGQVIVDVNGYLQKCTAGGTSGGSQPAWVEVYGTITTDNTVAWTNQGAAGFANGDVADYTFVTALDNTQFGQILIGANVAATCQNIADAINGLFAQAGITFSLPTWENPQVNADEPAGATTVVIRNKAAGAGFVVALAKSGANLAWSGSVTSGGSTTFGTQSVTVGVQGQTTGGTNFTIVYTPGSNIVTSATPLNAGQSLQIEYTAVNAQFIRIENSTEVANRAAIEQSTGKYQQSSSGDGSLSLPAFLAQAQAQLTAYGVIPSTFEFTTMWAGLYVGQILTIFLSNPANAPSIINGDWYIQEINAESVPVYNEAGEPDRFLPGGGHFRYTIRCINTNQIGDWIDFWKGMKSGSGGGSSQVVSGGGSLGAGQTGGGYSHSFTCVAGTPLAITHGLNTTQVIAAAYDSNGNAAAFGSLVITDVNTITVTFGIGFTGTIVIIAV